MIKPHEIKSITLLTLPLMAAFLAQKGMQLIDTVMMGWIGPSALAAGSLGTGIYITTLIFCMGTLSAVGVFISRAKGANDLSDIKSNMHTGISLAIILSIPCMLIIWFSPYLLTKIGEDPAVVNNVILLLHGLVWGFPGFLLFLLLREFVSAFALTSIVMIVALTSLPLTFIANYVLIYGKFGFPQLGIAGIGYAGTIIMWFMFLCLFIYSKTNKILKNYISFEQFKFDLSQLHSMFYIGAPSGLIFVIESGMFLSATVMVSYFGVDTLAAFQIAIQCGSLAYAIPLSLSMATALRVGHASGANNFDELKHSVIISLIIGMTYSIIIAIIFIYAPGYLVQLFINSSQHHYQEVHQLAISFLLIAALFQCSDALQAIANGALRGMKDTFIPMIISCGCYWLLGVSSAYLLSFHTTIGAFGVWYGLTIGLTSTGVILMLRFVIRFKHYKKTSAYNM